MSQNAKECPCPKTDWRFPRVNHITLFAAVALLLPAGGMAQTVHDPGVRVGTPGAGAPISGLNANQQAMFSNAIPAFMEIDSVKGTVAGTGMGLGPRFNAEGCGQCHAAPALGGSSPAVNPQVAAAIDQGAMNQLPSFITSSGPVREARFPYTPDLRHADGGVHDLFVITGRGDAIGCNLKQPDFQQALNSNNVIFRVPTPTYGDGLIEAIPDSAILAQVSSQSDQKRMMGIGGRPNTNLGAGIAGSPNTSGNDGTITRFGWKAQNKSLDIFSGEAYNVEMGVTNELFPNERDETPGCQFNGTPEDTTNFDASGNPQLTDIDHFSLFMRFLDQPQPGPQNASTQHGVRVFQTVGCALCHTPSFKTGQSSTAALSGVTANLFSDLLLHHMGPDLADNVSQGQAQGDEFRTAPLWGLGQRIFFMHDGRTKNLIKAITAHASDGDRHYPDSEANGVVRAFKKLSDQDQQDLLNFLRSL
ncbi:MAG TPA: di-heme oxidoredictase family protein [Candidatus Sulfotelmatobacter sp.]|nr:di-heme oxidoredictase family protein [Candidatus Sulfotelmatobacter sp.]